MFWKLVGGMPERTPLEQRTVGSFEREGYRVEKIVYQSQPGLHVPANLYIPTTGKPPYAGVLFQMGHSLNGKAAEPYQKCCQGLARLGYVVLAFDPMGQGERTYYPKPGGTLTRLDSADTEHTLPGRQMLLVGDTATRMQVWDAVRSLDVLAGHPLVDSKRLASTGQSGGGTLTMLLAAADERLAVAAVSSGNTENFACADFNPPGSTDDAEQDLIASGAAAFDRWDLLYPLAPKPLLVMVSARDFFGTYSPKYLESGRSEYEKLKRVYDALGAGDRLGWAETPLPHALSYYLRTRIYQWFERWLNHRDAREIAEPAVAPERDETLWVGPTGNVVRDFASKTPIAMVRERTAKLRPGGFDRSRVEQLLKVDVPGSASLIEVARVPSERVDVRAIEVPTASNVWAPAWLFLPRKQNSARAMLLVVEPGGRSSKWQEGGLYQKLAEAGVPVCAADLRGVGDLAAEAPRGNPRYAVPHANDEAFAWASLILGKPMLGQRVTDLIAFVRALSATNSRIVLAASGSLTVPALFAASLEPRIEKLYLSGGLASYRSLLEVEEYRHPTANFVHGMLTVCDLPDVAASVSPRKVIMAGALNGAGTRMSSDALRSVYGGASNVEIQNEANWDLEALTRCATV